VLYSSRFLLVTTRARGAEGGGETGKGEKSLDTSEGADVFPVIESEKSQWEKE
jgi:hypothetical protein